MSKITNYKPISKMSWRRTRNTHRLTHNVLNIYYALCYRYLLVRFHRFNCLPCECVCNVSMCDGEWVWWTLWRERKKCQSMNEKKNYSSMIKNSLPSNSRGKKVYSSRPRFFLFFPFACPVHQFTFELRRSYKK